MRIYELARQVDKKSSEILKLAQSLGFEVKTASSSVTNEEAKVILKELEPDTMLASQNVVLEKEEQITVEHSNETVFFDPKTEYEAPRKKKKFFGGKKEKNKGTKLQSQNYSRPALPKPHSQKGARIFLAGLASVTLLVGIGASFAYYTARTSVQKESQALLQEGKASIETMSDLSRQGDYEAQLFCEDFASHYLNSSSNPDTQVKENEALQAYYGQSLAIASQGMKRNPSQLNDIRLLSITKDQAKFLVNVTTEEVKTIPAKGKTPAKKEVQKKTFQKAFNVPYGEKNGKYYVSSFPTLEDTPKLFAGKEAPKVDFTASSTVSSEEEKKLNTFVKSVLVAKSTNQNDLNLLASGLNLSTGETFKSIDYSYYSKISDNTYKAVIQASFSNGLGVVPENLTFTIEQTGQTYFAKDFSNVIQAKDLGK